MYCKFFSFHKEPTFGKHRYPLPTNSCPKKILHPVYIYIYIYMHENLMTEMRPHKNCISI